MIDALEESFIREAQMVFTTLSSTGRKVFTRTAALFEAVLVDEAAQATELATLQVLAFQCKQYAQARKQMCICTRMAQGGVGG